MPDETNISVVSLGNLAKPANTLIKKVSNAVGGLYTPRHIRQLASANKDAKLIEADAAREIAKIQAESEIEVTDLHQRAANRWIDEEARRQKNIEDITVQAAENLVPEARPDAMDDDWIVNFFDRSRIVSDAEMQILWSRVLAGEANSPGTYSKRTVNFLSDLDKSEAESFTNLCKFIWVIGALQIPLVMSHTESIYTSQHLNFYELDQLNGIGLIQFRTTGHAFNVNEYSDFTVQYFGKELILSPAKINSGDLNIGNVLLTKIGEQLAPLCVGEPVDGFYEYIRNKWAQYQPDQG